MAVEPGGKTETRQDRTPHSTSPFLNHQWNIEENGKIKTTTTTTTTVNSLFPSAFYKMAEQKLRTVEGESAQDQTLF